MFRYAFRTLAKNPAWTLAAVACLAIGIGANTTVYTAMRAIVIAPVPTPNSDRLVMMAEVSPRNPDDPDFDRIAPANLVDWMRQTRTLEHIAGFAWWDVNITGIEEPERVTGFRVTPEFFRTLGERPMLGRAFTDDEGRDGHTDRRERDRAVELNCVESRKLRRRGRDETTKHHRGAEQAKRAAGDR